MWLLLLTGSSNCFLNLVFLYQLHTVSTKINQRELRGQLEIFMLNEDHCLPKAKCGYNLQHHFISKVKSEVSCYCLKMCHDKFKSKIWSKKGIQSNT